MVHYVKYLVVVSALASGENRIGVHGGKWLAHGPSFGGISTTHSTNIVTVETLNVLRRARMGLKRKEKRGELSLGISPCISQP
jgi:hypothetical protein